MFGEVLQGLRASKQKRRALLLSFVLCLMRVCGSSARGLCGLVPWWFYITFRSGPYALGGPIEESAAKKTF